MKPTTELLIEALDSAFQAQIGVLFNVLLDNLVSKETDGLERFKRGVGLVIAARKSAYTLLGL